MSHGQMHLHMPASRARHRWIVLHHTIGLAYCRSVTYQLTLVNTVCKRNIKSK